MLVYSVKGHHAIHFIKGHQSVLMMDPALATDDRKFSFHIQQHVWQSGINRLQHQEADSAWKRVDFGGQQIVLSGTGTLRDSIRCDILVLRYPCAAELPLVPKKVVIASSLKAAEARKQERFFLQRKIPVVYVVDSGAFQLSL